MTRFGALSFAAAAILAWGGAAQAEPDKPAPASSNVMRARPSPSGFPGMRGGHGDVAEAFRKRPPNQEELKATMTAAQESAKLRREARRLEVRQRYTGAALSRREVLDELRVHARRMAFLHRAKAVATTDIAEPKRAKVLARVEKLTESEQARHRARMEALRAPSPADSAGVASLALSGSRPGPPAPSGGPGAFKGRGPALGAPGVTRVPATKGSAP